MICFGRKWATGQIIRSKQGKKRDMDWRFIQEMWLEKIQLDKEQTKRRGLKESFLAGLLVKRVSVLIEEFQWGTDKTDMAGGTDSRRQR